jgi:class 3 adenylate cyclase
MAQSEAPHTRGFLFADLRGYTQFVETHGDKAASELLTPYRTLVRAAVAKFDGAEIRTEGDGFYVVFPSASSAIRCALAILEEAASSTAAAGGRLPVGIGIHAGETEDSAEGFVGSAVNIAARVCALAGPGEVLVTETVRGLVRTSMPLAIEPRGRRHLKGIREPIALFAVRPSGTAPPTRAQRLRSQAVGTLERRPLAAGFAALVGVAIVATVVLAIGLLTNTDAFPTGSGVGSGLTGSSPSPTPSPSADDTFPNAEEQSLLDQLDPAIARLCKRAAESDYPRVALPGEKPTAIPVHAGLRCPLGGSQPDVVFLLRVTPFFAGGAVTTEFWFGLRVSLAKAQPGDCVTDTKAYMKWSFGLGSGKLLCSASPARARIDWIFDGEDLIAWAERDDADRVALYQWWVDVGRVILH